MAQIIKFPTSCKRPENCRGAFFVKDNIWFALQMVHPKDMDKLEKSKKYDGSLPIYFDRLGRIWPNLYGKVIYR